MRDSRYKMARYDGGFAPHPRPEASGIFQLTAHKWQLVFRGSKPGVTGGLLRVHISAEPLGATSCRVSVRGRDDGDRRGTFDLPTTPAAVLDGDVRRRLEALAAVQATEEQIERGSWWLRPETFAEFGWASTASISRVRYLGGLAGRPATSGRLTGRWNKFLDVSPAGVTLRDFRRKFTIPWEDVTALEVAAAGSVAALVDVDTDGERPPVRDGSSVVVVGLRSGERAAYGTEHPADEIRQKLERILAEVSGRPSVPGAG